MVLGWPRGDVDNELDPIFVIPSSAEFPLSFKLPMVILGAFLVPALTYYNRFLLQTILVPLAVSMGITAISWVIRWVFVTNI